MSKTPSTEKKPEFFSVAEVAERLKVSSKTIRRRIEAGRLKAIRDDGQWLIPPAEYFAYVESLPRKRQV